MNLRPAAALLAAAVALAGCAPANADTHHHKPSPHPTVSATTAPGGIVVAQGHGWDTHGLYGPIPAPGTCHLHTAAGGEPLPDPHCTPGAKDTAVTDQNTADTVCRKGGYTSSVRPPESLTGPAKLKLMDAYGIPESQVGQYELDHLVDLAAGGASDVRNLFPEPDHDLGLYPRSAFVRNDKDAVESYTFHAICAGKVTVTAVQSAIATDWSTAVAKLGLPPIPASYSG